MSAQDRQPNLSAVDEARELLAASGELLGPVHGTSSVPAAQVLALQAIAASQIALHDVLASLRDVGQAVQVQIDPEGWHR